MFEVAYRSTQTEKMGKLTEKGSTLDLRQHGNGEVTADSFYCCVYDTHTTYASQIPLPPQTRVVQE